MTGPTSPTRRALLSAAGAGLLAAAAGCDRVTGLGTTRPEEPPAGAGGDAEDHDADEALLESIRTAMLSAAALVTATLDQHPVLATDLLALQELHSAHLAVLDPEDTSGDAQSETPDDILSDTPAEAPGTARRDVLRREASLLELLSTATTEAESGRFARLLAATAAGLAQQLARLEEPA